jgi:protein required for attachment to host cells
MFIPKSFPEIKQKTLFVIANHTHTKFFVGEGRAFQFIEEYQTDYPPKEGGDRTSLMTPGGTHSAEQNEKDQIIGEDHLFHRIAKDLFHRLQNHEYESLVIAAGPEVHQLEHLLHAEVRERVVHLIPKLLVNLDDAHLLEHIL